MNWTEKPNAMVYLTQSELGMLLKVAMACDPVPENVNIEILHDALDRAAVEMGYLNWIDAYHRIP